MAFTRQLSTQQSDSHHTTNNSGFVNQNARREEEANRTLCKRQLAQSCIEAEMQEFEVKAANKRYLRKLARVERDGAMEETIIRTRAEFDSLSNGTTFNTGYRPKSGSYAEKPGF